MAGKDREEHDYLGRCERLRQIWKFKGGQAERVQRKLLAGTQSSSREHQATVEKRQGVGDSDPKLSISCLKTVGSSDLSRQNDYF